MLPGIVIETREENLNVSDKHRPRNCPWHLLGRTLEWNLVLLSASPGTGEEDAGIKMHGRNTTAEIL
jgi:hypothetical protein